MTMLILGFPQVIGVKVFLTAKTQGEKKIFAYIRMGTKEQARKVITNCNNSLIQGSRIRSEMVTQIILNYI